MNKDLEQAYEKFIKDYANKSNTVSWFLAQFKTHLSKNITLEDWNTLQQNLKNIISDNVANKDLLDSLIKYLTNYEDATDETIKELYNKLTKNNLISIIGNATETTAGVMSAADKKNLNNLVKLLQNDTNNIVDTIKEVLIVFEQYPEGADLVTALAGKADKSSTYSKTEIDSKLGNIDAILDAINGEVV